MHSPAHLTPRVAAIAGAAAVLALSCGGAQAGAATVSSELRWERIPVKGAFEQGVYYTAFAAAPGEDNRLSVRRENGVDVFTEAALPLTAGSLCSQRGSNAASCFAGKTSVAVGDGDDRVDDDVSERVDGGTGSDTLTGRGTLIGGPGSDTLIAKPVPRYASDEAGDGRVPRFVDDGPAERDTYTGASNHATVSYEGRATPLRIDLRRDTNEDRLIAIRSITGGEADDVIVGDDHANELVGRGGRDRLTGGRGDDHLVGGGDDQLSCGPGVDTLAFAAYYDDSIRVPRDCERASLDGAYVLRGAPVRRGRSIEVRVDQVLERGHVIALFAGRRPLGHSRPVGRRGVYRVALNPVGRRLARRGRTVHVSTTPSGRADAGKRSNAFRYRLR